MLFFFSYDRQNIASILFLLDFFDFLPAFYPLFPKLLGFLIEEEIS